MRMNEGFFGQYSVFCVFGSVVGCVVVPLIAQVLQQQSMECVILSAIVISLTAAHLNKKGGNDATASYSKIVVASELERKKANHYKKQKNYNQQQQQQQQQQQLQLLTTAEQVQLELEHMQQREMLKTMEVERRSEEKRLKKLRKREERLKKREEENKKQKELEEHYRSLKEKRLKQQKENYFQTNKNYMKSAAQNLEKFCGGSNSEDKRCGLALLDANRVQSPPMKSRTLTSNNTPYYQQKIPRFERSRTGSCISDSVKSSNGNEDHSLGSSNTLTIKCNLSASCSSLSSISSLSSGSASPPMSASSHHANTTTPWLMSGKPNDSLSVLSATTRTLHDNTNVNVKCPSDVEKSLKSYSNNRVMKTSPQKLIPDSSSLFCSQLDRKGEAEGRESQPIVGEYSLFGPRRFVASFAR